jgi:hypothetical protein
MPGSTLCLATGQGAGIASRQKPRERWQKAGPGSSAGREKRQALGALQAERKGRSWELCRQRGKAGREKVGGEWRQAGELSNQHEYVAQRQAGKFCSQYE